MEYLHTLWMVQRSLAIAIAGPALGLQHIHTSAATRAGDIGLDDRSRQIERQSPNRGAAACQCQRLSQCVGDCKREGQKIRISCVLACQQRHLWHKYGVRMTSRWDRAVQCITIQCCYWWWKWEWKWEWNGNRQAALHIPVNQRLGCTHRSSGTIKSYCLRYCNDQDIATQGNLHILVSASIYSSTEGIWRKSHLLSFKRWLWGNKTV